MQTRPPLGTRVIVYKPEDVSQNPGWMTNMDKLDGLEGIVTEICSSDIVMIIVNGERWNYHVSWIELASNPRPASLPGPGEPDFDETKGDF